VTNEEYQCTQNHLQLIASIAATLDLGAFLSRIDYANTVGPIVDPTLYRDAMDNLGKLQAIARAARPLAEEAKRQLGET
jgi:hypothetical protein